MPKEADTASCWSGAKVFCPGCKGPTRDLDDEYGSLSDGGSYERFKCVKPTTEHCRKTIYVELPD